MTAPIRPVSLAALRHGFEDRADGTTIITCLDPLGTVLPNVGSALRRAAALAPERIFVAQRGPDGSWRHLTYRGTLARATALAGGLQARGLSAERPLAILSGNDLDHAALALAAMLAGIPYAPISPAYSSAANGFGRLRDVLGLLTPGLVFVANAPKFASAIAAAVSPDVEVVAATGTLPDRKATPLEALEGEGEQVDEAAVGPATIAKFLFTSGSTGLPKAVVTTHGMLCANAAQLNAAIPFFCETPPVLVDWLPWHHVFGGSHNFDIVLFNAGTLYIDDGRPLPASIGETVCNLREVPPTCYLSVPKGYEVLLPHLQTDRALRDKFFSRLQLAFFAAAGLPQPVWDAFDALSVAATGERVTLLTGFGATESAPSALICAPQHCRSGRIGLPVPGTTVKLAPVEAKVELRIKGPNVTPGYWRRPELTAQAFDDEHFYRFGDAVRFAEPARPSVGLRFDGRLGEDFKLSSGTWVSVGPLRARILDAAQPCLRDVAIAGEMRDDIRLLLLPDLLACQVLAGRPDAAAGEIYAEPAVRAFFAEALGRVARAATGSSNRPVAALLLVDPPSMDANEITDKGSINQRSLLGNRQALVEDLYRAPPSPHVILLHEALA